MSSLVLEVHQHCELHGASRAVYVALAAYVEAYGEPVYPSLTTLAKTSDISRRQVIRCLKFLATAGYLSIIRRHNPGCHARNLYHLRFPWRDEMPQLKVGDILAEGNLKVGDILCDPGNPKTEKKEKKEPVGDTPPQVDPVVLGYHMTNPKAVWLGLRPGTEFYALCLNGSQTHEGT